jgi:hypothetical protein
LKFDAFLAQNYDGDADLELLAARIKMSPLSAPAADLAAVEPELAERGVEDARTASKLRGQAPELSHSSR